MGNPMRPRGGRGWRRRRAVVITDAADEEQARRPVGLALFIALLLMGGVFGIVRACSAHHPAHRTAAIPTASPSVRPYALVGGGGVPPRDATGKLAVADSVGQVLFAEDGTALDSYAQTVINHAALAIHTAPRLSSSKTVGATDARLGR